MNKLSELLARVDLEGCIQIHHQKSSHRYSPQPIDVYLETRTESGTDVIAVLLKCTKCGRERKDYFFYKDGSYWYGSPRGPRKQNECSPLNTDFYLQRIDRKIESLKIKRKKLIEKRLKKYIMQMQKE